MPQKEAMKCRCGMELVEESRHIKGVATERRMGWGTMLEYNLTLACPKRGTITGPLFHDRKEVVEIV